MFDVDVVFVEQLLVGACATTTSKSVFPTIYVLVQWSNKVCPQQLTIP